MTDYPLDIIIPVWNHPVEVRAALSSFAAGTPMARLIMVNNGSERETECILDEFAESLDDRALLVATDRNIGSVASLNLGLTRATGACILITSPFTRLEPGWFDPVAALFDKYDDVGSIVITKKDAPFPYPMEADHGSFDAMVIRKSLYVANGGFNEQMDDGLWALRDYARKALAAGYRTFSLPSRHLEILPSRKLGSTERRQEKEELAKLSYSSCWGESNNYFILCSDELFGVELSSFKEILLDAARQGEHFTVAAGGAVAKSLVDAQINILHDNIFFHSLPRFFPDRNVRKIAARVFQKEPSTVLISDIDNLPVDMKKSSFQYLVEQIQLKKSLFQKRGQ